ncbi:hypothetical protein O181_126944, partial [Austropuccinia psidii MF-1]|nr:hypothetical protein [Austropuccinia psidii MF-1]
MHLHLWSIKKKSLDVTVPVHQEKKLWMMRMRTCLPITVKQMMNQGGTTSWHMRKALSQI